MKELVDQVEETIDEGPKGEATGWQQQAGQEVY